MSIVLSLAIALLTPLPLPQYFSVTTPFAKTTNLTRNPFAVNGGAVAADIDDGQSRSTIAVWRSGKRVPLPPILQDPKYTSEPPPSLELGTIGPSGMLYGMRGQPFSGAYSGIAFDILRLNAGAWNQVALASCKTGWNVPHLERVESNGTFDVTYESPELINFDEASSGIYAPYAAQIRGGTCQLLGRFNVRDVNSGFAVGYRGYLDGSLAPTNLNLAQQRYVAVRYHAGKVAELGPGEAFSVASDGTAVGSDAPTLHDWYREGDNITMHTYACCTPHAVLWDRVGRAVRIAPAAPQSIAYAIDERHRVIGTLVGRDGRHYAFLWQQGKLHLLDDLLHRPGWRFEGAYRFLPDGSVAGAGTNAGVATAFIAAL